MPSARFANARRARSVSCEGGQRGDFAYDRFTRWRVVVVVVRIGAKETLTN